MIVFKKTIRVRFMTHFPKAIRTLSIFAWVCSFSALNFVSCMPKENVQNRGSSVKTQPTANTSPAAGAPQNPIVVPPATDVPTGNLPEVKLNNNTPQNNGATGELPAICATMKDPKGSEAWCAFHLPHEECKVTDTEYLKVCKPKKSASTDCNTSASEGSRAWCAFHYSRRECGVSDSKWLKLCKPAQTPPSDIPQKSGCNINAGKPMSATDIKERGLCEYRKDAIACDADEFCIWVD